MEVNVVWFRFLVGSQIFHNVCLVVQVFEFGDVVGLPLVSVSWADVCVVGLWIMLCDGRYRRCGRYRRGVRKLTGAGKFDVGTRGSPRESVAGYVVALVLGGV